MTEKLALPRAQRRGIRQLLTGAVVLAAVWVGGLLVLGVAAQADRTCVSCHSMRVYESAMADSDHDSTGCVACHGVPGPLGIAADGFALSRRISAHLVGRDPGGSAAHSDSTCRSCHAHVLSETVTANGIAVRHADFAATPCTECHAGTGHTLDDRVYSATHMDDCLTCHRTSASNLEGCRLCHVAGSTDRRDTSTAWKVAHGPTWQTTHGSGDLETCRSCHPADYCTRCHGTPVPHPATWARGHGEEAIGAMKRASCETCHDPAWCERCHGVQMPHPDGFMAHHPSTTQGVSDARCMRCHEAQTCQECHLRSAHPAIPGVDFRHKPGDS